MKIDLKGYPIQLLEDLQQVLAQLREEIRKNKNIIIENKNYSGFIEITPTKLDLDFKFQIVNINLDLQKKSVFSLLYTPKNEVNNSEYSAWFITDEAMNSFNKWLEIIKRYGNLNFNNPILTQYENEIYEGIKILDEEANVEPFEFENQLLLLNYLNSTKTALQSKEESEEINKIIEEIDELQSEVTKISKNSFMKKLSSILAKGKNYSVELFEDMLKDFAKDFFKDQIKNIPTYINVALKLLEDYK